MNQFEEETYTNITIKKGSTFIRVIQLLDGNQAPVNLTDFTARSQIRPSFSSEVKHDFTVEITDPLEGEITWSMADTVTSTIDESLASTYVYDLEIESPTGRVSRILQGFALISPEVTR